MFSYINPCYILVCLQVSGDGQNNIIDSSLVMSHTLHLQVTVESAIINTISALRNKEKNKASTYVDINVSIQRFPEAAREIINPLYSILEVMMSSTVMICFSGMLNEWLSEICKHQYEGIRSSLILGGLHNSEFWASWCFSCFLLGSIPAIVLAVLFTVSEIFNGSMLLVIFLFLGYLFSIISIAIIFGALFHKSNVSCSFALMFIVVASIPVSVLTNEGISIGYKSLVLLLPPSVFLSGMQKLMLHLSTPGLIIPDDKTVTFTNCSSPLYPNDIPFAILLVFLYIDALLYFLIGMYFDRVVMGKRGGKLSIWSLLFCFKKCSKSKSAHNTQLHNQDSKFAPKVVIENMKKTYYSKEFGNVKALRGLTLEMYEGQITAILGQNGAGKTSTLNILTGQSAMTKGSAKIYGFDVVEDIDEVRSIVGICPQFDILFDLLSVKEHIRLYAYVKGYSKDSIDARVAETIKTVGLEAKTDAIVSTLSGGMRRRVSVAIAIIGDPKVLFLDEATSGVDPLTRRSLWDLFISLKKNRVVVLTTHFMDEADILGDRIAFLRGGVVQAAGSSLLLKQSFGIGYTLNITPALLFSKAKVLQVVQKYVNDSEEAPSSTKREDSLISIVLPFYAIDKFPTLFNYLQEQKEKLGIVSFDISVPSLQQVFMRLANITEEDNSDEESESAISSAINSFFSVRDDRDGSVKGIEMKGGRRRSSWLAGSSGVRRGSYNPENLENGVSKRDKANSEDNSFGKTLTTKHSAPNVLSPSNKEKKNSFSSKEPAGVFSFIGNPLNNLSSSSSSSQRKKSSDPGPPPPPPRKKSSDPPPPISLPLRDKSSSFVSIASRKTSGASIYDDTIDEDEEEHHADVVDEDLGLHNPEIREIRRKASNVDLPPKKNSLIEPPSSVIISEMEEETHVPAVMTKGMINSKILPPPALMRKEDTVPPTLPFLKQESVPLSNKLSSETDNSPRMRKGSSYVGDFPSKALPVTPPRKGSNAATISNLTLEDEGNRMRKLSNLVGLPGAGPTSPPRKGSVIPTPTTPTTVLEEVIVSPSRKGSILKKTTSDNTPMSGAAVDVLAPPTRKETARRTSILEKFETRKSSISIINSPASASGLNNNLDKRKQSTGVLNVSKATFHHMEKVETMGETLSNMQSDLKVYTYIYIYNPYQK
jgi:ABC-type multidrug transport system ATPase subunit